MEEREPVEEQEEPAHVAPHEASEVAQAVSKLKDASMRAARQREHLPQPLFWSLFHSQISELRKKKDIKRTLDRLLGGIS